jgi:prepilin-type N-terminal cleavage/methylation domain-containing protein
MRLPAWRRGRGFTLIEILIVVALVAIVMALALPRIGRLPARLQAERCVSAVQAALDETGLRARATGRPFRLLLIADEESSRFTVSALANDPLGLPLSGSAAPAAAPDPATAAVTHDSGLVPGATEYVLPDAVKWTPESLQEGTASGDEGPALAFYSSGEAGGPALEFVVGKRHYRLDVDRLTGRADIRLTEGP